MKKRTITIGDEPMADAAGNAITDAVAIFRLCDINGRAVTAWDRFTHQPIRSTELRAVVKDGVLTKDGTDEPFALWPTSRATAAVYYKCWIKGDVKPLFIAPLDDGDSDISWIDFMAAGSTITPAGLSAFAVHTDNADIHVTPEDKARWDGASGLIPDTNPEVTTRYRIIFTNGVMGQEEVP